MRVACGIIWIMSKELMPLPEPGDIAMVMTEEAFNKARALNIEIVPERLAIEAIARKAGLLKANETLPPTFLLVRDQKPFGQWDVTHPKYVTKKGEPTPLPKYYGVGELTKDEPQPVPIGWRTQAAQSLGVDHCTVVSIPGWSPDQRQKRVESVALGLAGGHLPITFEDEPKAAERAIRGAGEVKDAVLQGKGAKNFVLNMGLGSLLLRNAPDPFTIKPRS